MKKKKKKKSLSIVYLSVLLLFLGAAAAGLSYAYNYVKYWETLIYPGVKVQNIDLSGFTKEKALKTVKEKYSNTILDNKINIITQNGTYSIPYSKFEVKHNTEEVINAAFNYGKKENIVNKYKIIKNPINKNFNLKMTYNADKLKEVLNEIEKDTNKNPVNATIKMVSLGKFAVTADQKGSKLQKDKLEKMLKDTVESGTQSDTEIKAPIEDVPPAITQDKLNVINTRVATFSTEYASRSSAERANNIALSTKSINGTVLMPGDVFSFNDVVGKRTAERGYQQAPVIIDNKVDYDLGGGICQVSSTLYNAMLRANVKATVRAHHTIPSSYVPLGMDATVDFGNIDYKFKNTLPYAIYIEAYTAGGNIGFNVYTSVALKSKSYDVTSEVYQTVQAGTKYVDDPNMASGQTETVQKGYTGYKVKVYKKNMENGALVGQELVSDDYYRPIDTIIKRGTKKV